MDYLKVSDYAKKYDLSANVVYKKIRKKILQTKKIDGKIFVLDDPKKQNVLENEKIQGDKYKEAIRKKIEIDNRLKLEKLKNLHEDIILKKQRQIYVKEMYRQEFIDGVFQAFTNSFSDLKNFVIALKLNGEQVNNFKQTFSNCIKNFENELKKYLAEKDRKQFAMVIENEIE